MNDYTLMINHVEYSVQFVVHRVMEPGVPKGTSMLSYFTSTITVELIVDIFCKFTELHMLNLSDLIGCSIIHAYLTEFGISEDEILEDTEFVKLLPEIAKTLEQSRKQLLGQTGLQKGEEKNDNA